MIDEGSELAQLDGDLMAALSQAGPSALHAVTARAALVSLEAAGFSEVLALQPSLESLRRGGSALPPFDNPDSIHGLAVRVPRTVVAPIPEGRQTDRDVVPQQPYAVTALLATIEPDPLEGAVEALVAAAIVHGPLYREALAAIRKGLL